LYIHLTYWHHCRTTSLYSSVYQYWDLSECSTQHHTNFLLCGWQAIIRNFKNQSWIFMVHCSKWT